MPLDIGPITRSTARDSYIMAQALFVAMGVLRERDHPFKELSNADDMEAILDKLWPDMKALFISQELRRRAYLAGYAPKADEMPATDDELVEWLVRNEKPSK